MDGRSGEEDAAEVLATHWSSDIIPVDPIKIARSMGMKVYEMPLEPGISGVLRKPAGGDPEIYLNSDDHYNRQRFTCAHEIGHFVRRSTASDEQWEYIDYRSPLTSAGTDPAEMYANGFAAELLMPRASVRKLADNWGVTALASFFKVSVDAITFRLKNLRLL